MRRIERRDEFVLRVEWPEVAKYLASQESADFDRTRSHFAEPHEALVGFAHHNAL